MEIFYVNHLKDLPKLESSSCTIGNFDGVHLGHRKLIEQTKIPGYRTMVITFENLNKQNYSLTNRQQKINYLEKLDIDYLIIIPFDVIKNVFYNEFIKALKSMKVKFITCGEDFRFGFQREGDIIDLKNNFKVTVFEDVLYDRQKVSTSLIKEYLIAGDLDNASNLLEKQYKIIGKVVEGNKIGRKLGFPTANIDYEGYLLPKNGVYLTNVKYKGQRYIAMTNIGFNPTINEQKQKRLEVHILDFNEEIYGEYLEITFVKYLREEKKYSSKDELVESLKQTIKICKQLNI